MKQIGILCFLILVASFFGCWGQLNDKSNIEISVPKHNLVQKWISDNGDGTSPTFVLEFQDNNILRIETTYSDGSFDAEFFDFEILGENNISFKYTNGLNGKPITMFASTDDAINLKLRCYFNGNIETPVYKDPPILCMKNRIRKSN